MSALAQMADAPGEPIVIPAGPMFLRDRDIIERLLLERRIPSVAAFRELAQAGALMSYGVDLVGVFEDVAVIVDQVAKGRKPAEMPITQSSRFHLAINLNTAKALGVDLPPTLLASADEVLESQRRCRTVTLGRIVREKAIFSRRRPTWPARV
jgi:putative ABC transport system substrate-binding protein